MLQALVVQLGCMAYEFYLLQRCNVSHMRLYSVFLALPSATVRLMAARQLQVDDDSREEVDEDDMELAEAAAGVGAGAASGPADAVGAADAAMRDAPEKKQKSVRMVVAGRCVVFRVTSRCTHGGACVHLECPLMRVLGCPLQRLATLKASFHCHHG
jgi:hypothetical protein